MKSILVLILLVLFANASIINNNEIDDNKIKIKVATFSKKITVDEFKNKYLNMYDIYILKKVINILLHT